MKNSVKTLCFGVAALLFVIGFIAYSQSELAELRAENVELREENDELLESLKISSLMFNEQAQLLRKYTNRPYIYNENTKTGL